MQQRPQGNPSVGAVALRMMVAVLLAAYWLGVFFVGLSPAMDQLVAWESQFHKEPVTMTMPLVCTWTGGIARCQGEP